MSMTRRDIIKSIAGCAAAWPSIAKAQKAAGPYRIFWVSTEAQPDPFMDGFREGLRGLGYVEGKDVVFELRYAPGNPDGLRAVIAELTRGNVDLAVSSGPAIRAMRAATVVPILFAISGDPVELGLVKSLAQPGGNFTGSTFLSLDLAGKSSAVEGDLSSTTNTCRALKRRPSGRALRMECNSAGRASDRDRFDLCTFCRWPRTGWCASAGWQRRGRRDVGLSRWRDHGP